MTGAGENFSANRATVQPCIFLHSYRGQEARGVRLAKIPSKKAYENKLSVPFLFEIFAGLNYYLIDIGKRLSTIKSKPNHRRPFIMAKGKRAMHKCFHQMKGVLLHQQWLYS